MRVTKKSSSILIAVLILCMTVSANAATLIGHWGFEEGSGTDAFDSSGNALNGTIYGATYTTGKVGSHALNFNGSSSYVKVPYSTLLTPATISISLWFNPGASQSQWADILDKGHGRGSEPYYFGGYVLQYHGDGGVPERGSINAAYGNGSSFPFLNTGGDYRDEIWHHIVAVLGEAEISLYVDNVLINSIASQGPLVENYADLYFGRHRFITDRYFNGAIDDVQLFKGALTKDEVSNLYKTGTVVPLPASLLLFGPALAVLAAIKRRFKG